MWWASMERITLLEGVLEPNGAAVHDLLLELDSHMDLIDADFSEDAPTVWRLTRVGGNALVIQLQLRSPAPLLLLQLLRLLMQSLDILLWLLARAQEGIARLHLLLLLRLEDVVVATL